MDIERLLLEKGIKVGSSKLCFEKSAYGEGYLIKDSNGGVVCRVDSAALSECQKHF